MNQVHNKFKIFSGTLSAGNDISHITSQAEDFVNNSHIAAKSIGVEYVEAEKALLFSIGYNEGTDSGEYKISIQAVALGKIDVLGKDFSAMENAMSGASDKYENILCHELFITDEDELMMIFMLQQ